MNLKTTLIGLVIPLIMGIGDLFIELSVKISSKFRHPNKETENLNAMIFGITWI